MPQRESNSVVNRVETLIGHGINANKHQFGLHLVQIFLVGLTVGMTRLVVPGLAESEFGLAGEAFFLLASFVWSLGLSKPS